MVYFEYALCIVTTIKGIETFSTRATEAYFGDELEYLS